MSSRTDILDRLRLFAKPDREYLPSHWEDQSIFADFPENPDNYIDIFSENLKNLNGEFYLVKNFSEASRQLLHLLKDIQPDLCRTHFHPFIQQLRTANRDIDPYLNEINDKRIDSEKFASFEVGITTADYLIARTGSILIRTTSAGGRRLSVLPPLHIVIAGEKQLVPSIDHALSRIMQKNDNWSFATIISGPSRTSDIEKQLVLGAHGPKRLIVLLIQNHSYSEL